MQFFTPEELLDTSIALTPMEVSKNYEKIKSNVANQLGHTSYSLERTIYVYSYLGNFDKLLEIMVNSEDGSQFSHFVAEREHNLENSKNFSICSLSYIHCIALRSSLDKEYLCEICAAYLKVIQNCKSNMEVYYYTLNAFLYISKQMHEDTYRQSPLVKKALLYIKEHVCEDISLTDITTHCKISSTHLTNIFKNELGLTPTAYLGQYRATLSIVDLALSKKTIKTISKDYGFSSQNAYNKAFHRHFTITPLFFRESLGKNPYFFLL